MSPFYIQSWYTRTDGIRYDCDKKYATDSLLRNSITASYPRLGSH